MKFSIALLTLSFSSLALLTGCSGGLIGTSTGPKGDSKNVLTQSVLPEKLSPRMPLSLLDAAAKSAEASLRAQLRATPESQEQQRISQSWQRLSPLINSIENNRLDLHEELTLLDSVFDQVLRSCGTMEQGVCEVPALQIEALYTQELVEALYALPERSPEAQLEELELGRSVFEQSWYEHLLASVGSSLSFGQISYSVDEQGKSSLQLAPLRLMPDQNLIIEWSKNLQDVRYISSMHRVVASLFTAIPR